MDEENVQSLEVGILIEGDREFELQHIPVYGYRYKYLAH